MSSRPPTDRLAALLRVLMQRSVPPRLPDPAEFLQSAGDPRRFPAALLAGLAGPEHPAHLRALAVLDEEHSIAGWFGRELTTIRDELDAAARAPQLDADLSAAAQLGTDAGPEAFDLVWRVFFPEGVGAVRDWAGRVEDLRRRRHVEIKEYAVPLRDPVREVLFTSNVLVSPSDGTEPDYWYDHPIPLEASPDETELAHGLRGLDEAIAHELRRHPEWQGPATIVLSMSSTHRDTEAEARQLVERVVAAAGPFPELRIYAFDERSTVLLWEALLDEPVDGHPVFGVSGSYGRHYNFLKAIAALWSVGVDKAVAATFKIDLDQVFPQEILVAATGRSALENLVTPRWGAIARTVSGEVVHLAMIAGGLVNQGDIDKELFTPDVTRARPGASHEDTVFYSRLPQALSTEAEIMMRDSEPALERVHVTGGTNGILVSGLRRWRLYTPSIFGRAEDQAYIISGLGGAVRPGYLHAPGLLMRHDKADLIPEVIRRTAPQKHLGDLVRTRLFTSYAAAYKQFLDPFTGAFISHMPRLVTALRFSVRALESSDPGEAGQYIREGVRRLEATERSVADLGELVAREKREWGLFYDAIDELESGLDAGTTEATQRRRNIRAIVEACRVDSG